MFPDEGVRYGTSRAGKRFCDLLYRVSVKLVTGHLSIGQDISEAVKGYCDTVISITGELAVFAMCSFG